MALEFEAPYRKRDLIRLKDKYGRQKKGYENKKFMQKLDTKNVIFTNSDLRKKYKLYDRKIIIEKVKIKNQIYKYNNKSVSAILDGKIVDQNKKTVLSYGEIIKTKTLKILTKQFNIHKPIKILNVI